jgi:hypothetical protein
MQGPNTRRPRQGQPADQGELQNARQAVASIPIADIVGDCHQRDLGDTAALARSICDIGLLHPPFIPSDNLLIGGSARLAGSGESRREARQDGRTNKHHELRGANAAQSARGRSPRSPAPRASSTRANLPQEGTAYVRRLR